MKENIKNHHLHQMIQQSHPPIHYHQANPSMSQMVDFLKHHFDDVGILGTKLQLHDVNTHQLLCRRLDSRSSYFVFLLR